MRIVSIVGARPQFVKAASICRVMRLAHEEILVHTGQHYDAAMSDVFFEELEIPRPDYDLGVGSGSHGRQTGEMLGLLDELLAELRPDAVVVYGDTNTTLAGALAAAKLGVPVAHVEAGLRSGDRAMPEELNRIVVDHVSDLLFAPTAVAVRNLEAEGVTDGVELVGDVMLDTALFFAERTEAAPVLARHGLRRRGYALATVHRAATSDSPERLAAVIDGLERIPWPVLWAVHPRTRANLARFKLDERVRGSANITAVEPLPYGETIALLREAAVVMTDSGGMQKEAYFFSVPCVTLRDTTEWVETVALGWNVLTGTDPDRIAAAVAAAGPGQEHPDAYGDGHAAEAIVHALEARFGR